MASHQNVLILTSNTGGGHRSAASALEDSLLRLDPGGVLVRITQVLEEASLASRSLANFYNFLLRDYQHYMKYYYWAINKLRPNESKLLYSMALRYGMRLFERFCPSVIVSVHPMTHHFFAYILRKLNLLQTIPIITVVTDPCYGFWRGWACEDVQEYYVASYEAKQQLLDYGVASHKINISGMPVHHRFQPVSADEKAMLRQSWGLDPNKFTVFINCGWVGGGNIPRIYQELIKADLDIQAIFLGGQNEKLISESYQMAQHAQFPVRVVGYTDEIHKMMQASDIMVSKLGGLTTFEALATQLPIIADIVTPPMPQEEQTATFIEKTGSGVLLSQPQQIVSVVQSLIDSPESFHSMRQSALIHGKPGAVDRIANDILGRLSSKDRVLEYIGN